MKSMKVKSIKQSVSFKVAPEIVFDALMNSKTHSAFTGCRAKMSMRVGAKFTAFDGWILGKNMGIVRPKKIV